MTYQPEVYSAGLVQPLPFSLTGAAPSLTLPWEVQPEQALATQLALQLWERDLSLRCLPTFARTEPSTPPLFSSLVDFAATASVVTRQLLSCSKVLLG